MSSFLRLEHGAYSSSLEAWLVDSVVTVPLDGSSTFAAAVVTYKKSQP